MLKNRSLPRVPSVIIAITFALLFGFQNCSRVEFARDLAVQKEKIDSSGLILINNNDPYTTEPDVQLTLSHNGADEMYITNDPTCKSGGDWEDYATIKNWKLSAKNTDVKVYATFREKSVPDVQSVCTDDGIVHDDIAPTVDITKNVAKFINTKEAAIEFVARDTGSGIQDSTCKNDGGTAAACDGTANRTNLNEGTHSVEITARDKAGNTSNPKQVNFTIDLTKPTITFTSTPAKMTSFPHADFKYAAIDTLSGIKGYECKKSAAAAWQSCGDSIGIDYVEGPQRFTVRAIDNAGNTSDELIYDWVVDLSVVSVQITKGPGPFSNVVKPTFEFIGMDGTTPITIFECTVDATTPVSCTSPFITPTLTAGTHKFSVVGLDKYGNRSAPAVYNWMIDLTLPTVIIVSGPPAVTNLPTATLVFTATDLESGIAKKECQIDGGGYVECDSPKSYAALAEGMHKFEVRATDKAGNVSEVASHTWKVDLTLPIVEITLAPPLKTNLTEGRFEFTATDPGGGKIAHIECRVDAMTAYETCTSPKIYTALAEGAHIFAVRAVDEGGNTSSVKTHSWAVDLTPPSINVSVMPLATIGVYETAKITYVVTDALSGVDTVRCGLNGNIVPCLAGETKNLGTLPLGTYIFTIIAKDNVGLEVTKEITWNVVDNTYLASQIATVREFNKFDVLVVIDNSGSMQTEQANMAARFGTFLDQFAGLDWQVAIVTTDISSDKNLADGRLIQMESATNTYVINSKMDLAKAKSLFAATIKRPEVGSSYEQGIGAAYRAIQRSADATKAVNAPNVGFFRSDAALAILVVTDADETPPSGTKTLNTPQGLVTLVKTTWASQKTFTYHSIIVKSGDTACLGSNGNESVGLSYEQISKLTGGLIGTVCATDYGSQLSGMAQATADLQKSATLNCLPLDTDGDGKANITVETADGSATPPYVVSGLNVMFETSLPVGDNKIKYVCLK